MIPYSGIERVRALGGTRMEVAFNGGWTAEIDLEPWIDQVAMLQPLRDERLFANARVAPWGWSVQWIEDELDIGGDQLWRLAGEQAQQLMPVEAFRSWRARHRLSQAAAATALGLPRRMVAAYDRGSEPIPRTVMLACRGWEAMQRDAA